MKWIIVIFVNFLPVTGQWEMYDYSANPFDSEVACLKFVVNNKQFLIDEANRAYRRNDKDYVIGCPTLDKFNDNVMPEEIAA
jgi:hypothetical protein